MLGLLPTFPKDVLIRIFTYTTCLKVKIGWPSINPVNVLNSQAIGNNSCADKIVPRPLLCYFKRVSWTKENSFDKSLLSQFPPSWPNEMLVKVLSSLNYSPIVSALSKPIRVFEVGIFSGNNARFLLENGYTVSGSELNEEMVDLGIQNLTRLGYEVPPIGIGENTKLPALNSEFDLLISINTIHSRIR